MSETDTTIETDYMVRVTIGVKGSDPAEAARKFVEHILTHGFDTVTFNVEDVDAEEDYLASLEGYAKVEDILALAAEGDGGEDVDDNVDEDEDEDEDEEAINLLVKGQCARCGELAETLNPDTMVCAQCRIDILGVA